MGQVGAAWMNLASLLLGLAAWALPLTGLALRKKARGWVAAGLVVLSGLFCALALYLQICYQNHLVEIGDISAILDTAGPLVLVAGVLLGVTAVLDVAVLGTVCGEAAKEA